MSLWHGNSESQVNTNNSRIKNSSQSEGGTLGRADVLLHSLIEKSRGKFPEGAVQIFEE
jgi:hypothetical protein